MTEPAQRHEWRRTARTRQSSTGCVLAKAAGGNITAANYLLGIVSEVRLWGQGSSKPKRKGDRFLSVKVTLKDWNWITSSKATGSCRQQIARDVEVGWTPLPTHARPIFVSLPTRPLSDTVVQSAGHIGSGGLQMKGPVFARWGPWLQFHRLSKCSAVQCCRNQRERASATRNALMHARIMLWPLGSCSKAPRHQTIALDGPLVG